MAIRPPEQRVWWNEPVERGEIIWIIIAFLWGVLMFCVMIWWHFTGQQNLSHEAYRIEPDVYAERTEAFVTVEEPKILRGGSLVERDWRMSMPFPSRWSTRSHQRA